jgi:hypothetical protein
MKLTPELTPGYISVSADGSESHPKITSPYEMNPDDQSHTISPE